MPRASPRDGRDQREMNRSGDVCRLMRGLGVHSLAGVFVQSLAHARRAPLRPCASPWLGDLGGQSLMHSADAPGLEALRCLASLPTGDLAEAGESRWGGRGGDSYRRAPWVRPRSGARGGPSPGPFRLTDQPLDEALAAGPASATEGDGSVAQSAVLRGRAGGLRSGVHRGDQRRSHPRFAIAAIEGDHALRGWLIPSMPTDHARPLLGVAVGLPIARVISIVPVPAAVMNPVGSRRVVVADSPRAGLSSLQGPDRELRCSDSPRARGCHL